MTATVSGAGRGLHDGATEPGRSPREVVDREFAALLELASITPTVQSGTTVLPSASQRRAVNWRRAARPATLSTDSASDNHVQCRSLGLALERVERRKYASPPRGLRGGSARTLGELSTGGLRRPAASGPAPSGPRPGARPRGEGRPPPVGSSRPGVAAGEGPWPLGQPRGLLPLRTITLREDGSSCRRRSIVTAQWTAVIKPHDSCSGSPNGPPAPPAGRGAG